MAGAHPLSAELVVCPNMLPFIGALSIRPTLIHPSSKKVDSAIFFLTGFHYIRQESIQRIATWQSKHTPYSRCMPPRIRSYLPSLGTRWAR